jgi:hypothetical protein
LFYSDTAKEDYTDMLDHIHLHQSHFHEIGAVLGNGQRIQEINPYGSGGLIHDSIQGDGSVTARLFLDWWLSEDYYFQLNNFMNQEFSDRAQLLERSSAQSCRYRIRKFENDNEDPEGQSSSKKNSAFEMVEHGEINPLSEIFAKIENRKESLHVQEYSVGQTTLEQIFNQFASQQDNPEVAMANDGGAEINTRDRARSSFVRVD